MKINNVRWAIGILAAVSALGMTTPAWSDDRGDHRRDRDRFDRHDRYDRRHGGRDGHRPGAWRRHEWQPHRGAWQFDRGHGWRFERRPGVWSAPFVWWRVAGRPLLRPVPTIRVVRYPTGYYQLIGDGFYTPYSWVWRPTFVAAAPPPVPLPPPAPADYPYDAYPPLPAPPTG